MKKILIPFVAVSISVFSICHLPFYILHAQSVHPVSGEPLRYCGTTEATQELYKKHPELRQMVALIEEQQKNSPPVAEPSNLPPVYVIPVVVHVLHNWGPENISDAQVKDAIYILNRDFRKQNADTTQIVPVFQPIAADCEIEFRLAQLDPNGACTNGIDRVATPLTYNADDNSKSVADWPRDKYLNIWVVNSIGSGAAGYSYYPSSALNPAIDGFMVRHDYFGSIGTSSAFTSRTSTHELAHSLNLQHVWGNTNNPGVSCGDDLVADTPITKGWTTCNLTSNDICNPGIQENVQNYMEYSFCGKMFTQGQRTRMRTALNSSVAQRINLWQPANLSITGVNGTPQLCTANFSVSTRVTCVGTPVTFTDLSWNGTPTSWQWDINNDGTTDYTTQNPTHTYNTPGTYSVKLTVSDGANTKFTTKTNYIVVLGNSAAVNTYPYSESFENTGFPYSNWYLTNVSNGSTNWNRITTAAFTGTASLKIDNYSQTTGDIYEVILPPFDMSNVTGPAVSFQVSHALRSSSDNDKLRMLISANCGSTWLQRYSKSGATLSTSATSSSPFTPTAQSQWRLENVVIPNCAGSPDCYVKFEFTGSGAGNNIYLDDINVTGVVGIGEETNNNFTFTIYPNPILENENAAVTFTLSDKHAISLYLFDIVGREIIPAITTKLSAGSYSFSLNKSTLSQGVYFVKLNVDGHSVTKKLIVQ